MLTDGAPLSALKLKLYVTPRWWAGGPHFLDDVSDVSRAVRTAASRTFKQLLEEIGADTTYVWVVLRVTSLNTVDAFDRERAELVQVLDAMDEREPRRRAVTDARLRTLATIGAR